MFILAKFSDHKGFIMKILLKKAVSLFLCYSIMSAAQASVITWDYTTTGEFTASSFTGSGATVTSTMLTWGNSTGSGRSSLLIDNSNASGSVDTFSGSGLPPASFIGNSIDLIHFNNPVTGSSLSGARLMTTVSLDPSLPDQPALSDQQFNFDIVFAETPNSGVCADISSPVPCNDIFVLEGGLPNFNFNYDAGDGDGLMTYFVNVFITDSNSLSILDDAICAAAGVSNGCFGLTTVERQSNLIPFGFTISAQPLTVNESSSMALIGLSLLLLGIIYKRNT